jgi:hypothetical protein
VRFRSRWKRGRMESAWALLTIQGDADEMWGEVLWGKVGSRATMLHKIWKLEA